MSITLGPLLLVQLTVSIYAQSMPPFSLLHKLVYFILHSFDCNMANILLAASSFDTPCTPHTPFTPHIAWSKKCFCLFLIYILRVGNCISFRMANCVAYQNTVMMKRREKGRGEVNGNLNEISRKCYALCKEHYLATFFGLNKNISRGNGGESSMLVGHTWNEISFEILRISFVNPRPWAIREKELHD